MWKNIGEKKVIDQKVGLKNYQHYLTSVAVAQVARGAPLNLNIKILNFGKKIGARGYLVITLIKTSSFSFFQFPEIYQVSAETKPATRHFQHLGILTGWLVNGTRRYKLVTLIDDGSD